MPESPLNQWKRHNYLPAINQDAERKRIFSTESDISVEPLYSPINPSRSYLENIGYPGQYPFTRGIQASMYRGRLWTMRQYAGYSSAEESNKRFKYLLSQGQTGLSVAFDLPTQTGYDSDHVLAQDEIGKVGVPICSLADMEALFDGISLDKITTSMTINATAPILFAFYLTLAKKQRVPFERIGGTVQNDLLKEYIARGTYIFPPEASIRLSTDLIAFCLRTVPKWNPISISGYHMREAGATAAQELGFTFANAVTYVKAAIASGLDVDAIGRRLSFFFASHNNLFEEIAKFRAARRMWARIMRQRFAASDPKSWMLRFHTQTAGVTLTAQQPDNNTVRTTVQALAAILGGTQSLHVNARDEALGLPSEESAALALRTQQLLANESGITDTVDPLAGSFFIEELTDKIESQAISYLEHIDRMGGAVEAVNQGYQRQVIENSAYSHQKLVESGDRVVVGVNAYQSDSPAYIQPQKVDPNRVSSHLAGLNRVRAERDNTKSTMSLQRLEKAALDPSANMMEAILESVEAYATLGEICATLRDVFGQYRQEI
jgi:methylmalonyl-CoA mutase N-terminal domain/subunit